MESNLATLFFLQTGGGDKSYWNQIDSYLHEHSEADISHSICPNCTKKDYPDT